MTWGAVAGAAISVVGSSMAADSQASAAQGAADTSAAASRYSADIQKQMYDQTREDQTPWRDTGVSGLSALNGMVGVGPVSRNLFDASTYLQQNPDVAAAGIDPYQHYVTRGWMEGRAPNAQMGKSGSLLRDFAMSDFQADPGYQFRMSEGAKALERSAAARGGLYSGRAMKDMDRFSQGLASEEYQNAFNRFQSNQNNRFNRLASLAGVGQTANNALQSAGQSYANAAGNAAMTAGGNAATAQLVGGMGRASAYQGMGNTLGRLDWGKMFSGAGGGSASSPTTGWDGYSGWSGGEWM